MKNMKKGLALLLAGVMVFGMTACGAKEEAPADAAAPEPAKTEAPAKAETPAPAATDAAAPADSSSDVVADVNGDGKITIGYISKNLVDPFHAPINAAAQEIFDQMKKDGKIDDWTGVLDGETDPNKQIDRADECITKNCDMVIILPAEATASDPAVTKMADAGIHVIVVNSKTDSTDNVAVSYCGSDDVYAGELLAKWVIEQVPDGGKYAHCQGIIGNSAQIQRGEGLANTMKDHPEFESVGDFPCDWAADKAANVATDMMNKYGDDLKAIICDNDDMSSAAQRACNDAGRKDIVCVGVDGNQKPLEMVKAGEMGATVLQDGVGQVKAAVSVIDAIIAGQPFEKENIVPFVLVTKDNVDQYLK